MGGSGSTPSDAAQGISVRLVVRPEAEADIEEIAQWYEEKQFGLGWQFAEEAGKSIGRALGKRNPPRIALPKTFEFTARAPEARCLHENHITAVRPKRCLA